MEIRTLGLVVVIFFKNRSTIPSSGVCVYVYVCKYCKAYAVCFSEIKCALWE